ncbi:hypothetical protein HPB52_012950 [Rhipicephalus sanguineus]|uniref:Uncharacterized protein n=1 Tax=Rhipicephalus sanguineus TaxID=34632 RepID=A0A9D4SUF8_RHISA|nr:hypothetical protein HPB52_012950 [Rhipicephalus sanguineus]
MAEPTPVNAERFNKAQCSAQSPAALYPVTLTDVVPPVTFTFSPLELMSRCRCSWPSLPAIERLCPVATWTVLDSADRSVPWTSRRPWEIQPRPLLGDPPLDAPEPFSGRLLSDRHPIEPPQPCTAEETRIVCRTFPAAPITTAPSTAAASLR